MKYFYLTVICCALSWPTDLILAQSLGEESEPSPESIDAAFTQRDAQRIAAGFSRELVDTGPVDVGEALYHSAELIIVASVLEQQYVYGANDVPSTHTTFLIIETIKGSYRSDTLVIIQPGGPSLSGDTIYMASTSHHFVQGETEMLFINLDAANPIEKSRVTIASRFRIVKNRIYSEDGYGVIASSYDKGQKYALTLSHNRHPDARFNTIQIGRHVLTKHFSQDETDKLRVKGDRQSYYELDDYLQSVDVNAFSAMLEK